MAIYRYKQGSLLNEVRIITNDSGGRRAYLFARTDATAEQLQQVKSHLSSLGWKTVPVVHEGRAALEVRGFKEVDVMEDALRANGWVTEPPSIEAQDNDQRTTKEKIGNATLKMAGLSYNIGDAAYLWYTVRKYRDEHKTADKAGRFFNGLDIAGGIGYALGSLALTRYGSRDQSQNTIHTASKKVQTYLRRDGVQVQEDSSLHDAVQEKPLSFFGKISHTMAKYPSETLNSIYVFVGAVLSSAAIYRTFRAHNMGDMVARREEAWDVGLGAVTAASALTGLLVKEKKIEEEDRRQGVGKVLDFIQEKPLRATGFGYMVATLFHAKSTRMKYLSGDPTVRKTIVGRGIFVGANIVSEILMALSSKGHGTGVKPDESVDSTVIAATAETIARQDPAKRDAMVHQVAGYLAAPDVLGGSAEAHAAELTEQLHALDNNPWAKKTAGVPIAQALPVTTKNVTSAPVEQLQSPGTKITAGRHAAMLTAAPEHQATIH